MSGLDNLPQNTVRNKILEAVKNRLEGIVKDYFVRFDDNNGVFRFMDITLDGSNPAQMDDRVFVAVVTGVDELTITEWFKDQTVPSQTPDVVTVSTNTPFPLSDTGRNVTIDFGSKTELTVGDSFEIRLNNSIFSIKGVYRWERVRLNKADPSLVIFPQKEDKELIVNDRYDCTLNLAITLWIEAESHYFSLLEEYLGEVLNRLTLDNHFGDCLNYDSWVSEVRIVDADGVSENVGAYIEFIIKYRHQNDDTRIKR